MSLIRRLHQNVCENFIRKRCSACDILVKKKKKPLETIMFDILSDSPLPSPLYFNLFCDQYKDPVTRLKGWSHGQIYSRMQILRIRKFYSCKQICPCDRNFSTFAYTQNLRIRKFCTWSRPSANLNLRIRKFCIRANLSM